MHFLLFLLFAASAHALHFYLDANQKRCFIEELPTDTVVEGTYRALEWSDSTQAYASNPELGIIVEVVVCPSFSSSSPLTPSRNHNLKTSSSKQSAPQTASSPLPPTTQATTPSVSPQTTPPGSPTPTSASTSTS